MMQHNKFAGEVPETLRFYENSDESSGISGIDLSYNCFTSFPWSFFTDDDDCLVPHLWGNRLSGTIPDEVFKSPKWERWKTQISRQEKGYGYSNYRRKKMSIEKSLKRLFDNLKLNSLLSCT